MVARMHQVCQVDFSNKRAELVFGYVLQNFAITTIMKEFRQYTVATGYNEPAVPSVLCKKFGSVKLGSVQQVFGTNRRLEVEVCGFPCISILGCDKSDQKVFTKAQVITRSKKDYYTGDRYLVYSMK
ncbi:hypothetical protein GLOIN_2v1847055 [Rhizophagus irregularis DAOM 181602=DAOM 197198]|nr:hypothetical protein GLOIN_2v1847055 [Rhizophagus irregularis DAOM 181602=DAOM 197198]